MKNRYDNIFLQIDQVAPGRPAVPFKVIEVGVWNGVHAAQMVNRAFDGGRREVLYVGFDLFEAMTPVVAEAEKNVKRTVPMADVRQRIEKDTLRAGHKRTVHLIKGDTTATLPDYVATFATQADFIWLDGGHSLPTIRSDLEQCLRLLAPGGRLLLDDYYPDRDDVGCKVPLMEAHDRLTALGCEVTVLPPEDVMDEITVARKPTGKKLRIHTALITRPNKA